MLRPGVCVELAGPHASGKTEMLVQVSCNNGVHCAQASDSLIHIDSLTVAWNGLMQAEAAGMQRLLHACMHCVTGIRYLHCMHTYSLRHFSSHMSPLPSCSFALGPPLAPSPRLPRQMAASCLVSGYRAPRQQQPGAPPAPGLDAAARAKRVVLMDLDGNFDPLRIIQVCGVKERKKLLGWTFQWYQT